MHYVSHVPTVKSLRPIDQYHGLFVLKCTAIQVFANFDAQWDVGLNNHLVSVGTSFFFPYYSSKVRVATI